MNTKLEFFVAGNPEMLFSAYVPLGTAIPNSSDYVSILGENRQVKSRDFVFGTTQPLVRFMLA
jgi:hypothetical protein